MSKNTLSRPSSRRRTCRCAAYPWPHRPGGGNCRWPDPPTQSYPHKAGTHAPVLVRRRSAIRRRILTRYELHPIKDRQRVLRWLPKLYVAYCRRFGYGEGFWVGGWPIPAMRITATTSPTSCPDGWAALARRTDWREYYTESPARRRARKNRKR